jgi:hypothetical protein
MDEDIEVSNAQELAAVVAGTGSTQMSAVMKMVSYRIPVHLLAPVDAMAAKSKKSRNAMLNLLIQVGLDEVRKHFSEEVAADLLIGESAALTNLLDGPFENVKE